MTKNVSRRLGCVAGHGGEQAILDHPFFKDIDWAALEAKKVKPPFKPKIVSVSIIHATDEQRRNPDLTLTIVRCALMDTTEKCT
jgi:novel protein kinase C epsilon type